jgi:hypothetical protein
LPGHLPEALPRGGFSTARDLGGPTFGIKRALPATVAGTLRLRPESGSVRVVDGERVLASTDTIVDGVVVPRDR